MDQATKFEDEAISSPVEGTQRESRALITQALHFRFGGAMAVLKVVWGVAANHYFSLQCNLVSESEQEVMCIDDACQPTATRELQKLLHFGESSTYADGDVSTTPAI